MTEPSSVTATGALGAQPEQLAAQLRGSQQPTDPPRFFTPALSLANFGIMLALMTPVLVAMTFKLMRLTDSPEEATAAQGIVLGVGALFALVANPLAGRLSDRTTSQWGMRRPWIIGGVVVGLGAFALIGAATSVWIVLVGWCLAQTAMNAALAASQATLPDQVRPERRGRVSGIFGMMTPLAVLAGSAIVNFLPSDMARMVVPALIATLLGVLFALTLKDRVLPEKPADPFTFKTFITSFVFNPLEKRDFAWAWISKFFVMFGYAGVGTFFPLYLTQSFGLGEQEAIGTILLANVASTVAILISSPLGGMLSDRLKRRRVFVAAAGLVMVVGLLVLAFAPSVPVLILGQAIIGLGAGSFFAVDLALVTEVLPNPEETAKDLGIMNIANALPQSIAPVLAPIIIGLGASTPLGGYSLFYLVGAIIALLGAVLVMRVRSVA